MTLTNSTPARPLRVCIGESDADQGHKPHEAIVLKAREMGLAGATVHDGGLD